ncbi:MAG TPA: phosphoribosyltransferase family protein [Solirubrobacterales bacterium]|nr:phosphoribosyltransferase family protein [Solirubrobacterales bacterium]
MTGRQPGRFSSRRDAGRQLAAALLPLAAERPVVIGLPRGGVPVAEEVAVALGAVLEVLAVRKIGAPGNPEYGIGAIAEDGTRVLDRGAVAALEIDDDTMAAIVARESAELSRRVEAYRGGRAAIALRGRTAIVVDDGVATGVTDTAALRAARRREPRRLVLAVPVCAPDSAARLRAEADELVCLIEPEPLYGVGQWYEDFAQVADAGVLAALARAGPGAPGKAAADRRFPADGAPPHRP